jgi:response regulator RpfG family c-di-GMP phosphodiesterase
VNSPERIDDLLVAPPGGPWTVLCVDDESNILSALRRVLRGAGYQVLVADGGAAALERLAVDEVHAVISDMRMPGMDGAQLLEQVHQRWPQVVRVLLTGQADMQSTVAAINRGRILRYLTKPWDEPELLATLREGVDRLALEREKTRLEALTQQQNAALLTLNAELEDRVAARTAELSDANGKLQRNHLKTIKVFSNLLELRGDRLAGHGRRVAETARELARAMGLPEPECLDVFVAGLLHDIGLIGTLDRLLAKPTARYTAEEMALFREHATAGEHSLLALDDMQAVLPMIRGHHERWDGQGFPDHLAGGAIPLGACILAVADTYDDLQQGQIVDSQLSAAEARTLMRQARGTQFNPEVLDVFLQMTEPQAPRPPPPMLRVPSVALEAGMVLAADLVSSRGVLMLTKGHRLTSSLIARMREFEAREGGALQISVVPPAAA